MSEDHEHPNSSETVFSARSTDRCMVAASRIHEHLMQLGKKIKDEQDPRVAPDQLLPVDTFLADMPGRRHAPKLVYQPAKKGRERWTQSPTMYVYAGIEAAFTEAGRMPGANANGYRKELVALKSWVEARLQGDEAPVPEHFTMLAARLFGKGVLGDRRKDRIEVLQSIEGELDPQASDLRQLLTWLEEDLNNEVLHRKGPPFLFQEITFAIRIVQLWNEIAERPIARKPDSNCALFVQACWESGFAEKVPPQRFKHILRKHIGQEPLSSPCGLCSGCRSLQGCKRFFYYWTL